ncbi:MAG: phytanoyl-CoA dioxygenase family protein [Armatimonadetes bacterium]|nr:phytanoyl-CoA dioxygenase family protein [Armatimonadota bacterium]MBS1728906.1 phytanoyl-CoA dioxygenase family protein [Armatimonadota bacterium]
MTSPSLNSLAEAKQLPAWSSWKDGTPAGYFGLEDADSAATFFRENGFVVIEGGFSPSEIEALREEATSICRGDRGEVRGMPPLTGDETDEEILRQVLCIHFPHKISDLMFETLKAKAFVEVLTRIIGPNVKCMQSMLFIKAAGKPGQAWHQDEVYIPTRDRTLTGGWIAMDDATVENGCLWVIPGSHQTGTMYFQEWHGDDRFDCSHEAQGFPYTNDDAVPVEVKAGSVVFFNGYLLHRSLPNYASTGFRRSLVNHYMSAESLLPWHWGGEMDGPVSQLDSRDIVMIAGEDPYRFRGYKNIHGVHIRPDGQGGCGSYQYNKK